VKEETPGDQQQGRPDIHPAAQQQPNKRTTSKGEKKERGHPYIITGLSGLDNHTACNPLHRNPLGAFLYYMNYTPGRSSSKNHHYTSFFWEIESGRDIIISFQSSLNICHSGVIRFLATSPRGLLLLSGALLLIIQVSLSFID
jgi:hypothetical protein